jgi:hypothetical protein
MNILEKIIEFTPFPKIARLKREAILTEKIDGTNAAIIVTDDNEVYCQSRSKIITVNTDNFGFAKWVMSNKEELAKQLGPGVHFGEWWGNGIQRGYGLKEKRFSLFNVHQWHTDNEDYRCTEAPLCFVVPILASLDKFSTEEVDRVMKELKESGSLASKGYTNPEGVVIYHTQNGSLFKVTYEYDEGKGAAHYFSQPRNA